MTSTHTLGVVLAGGAGRRVGGEDKGLLTLHDVPVVEHVLNVLRAQCDEVVIVANRNQDRYQHFARVIGDQTTGHAGPLAGIAAALALIVEDEPEKFDACQWLLTTPVDCPDLPADLRTRLHAALLAAPGMPCAFARDDHRMQPLFALYSLKYKEELLASARAALNVHASPLRWHMELDAIAAVFPDGAEAFRNLNTLQDFRDYERAHSRATAPYPMRISLEEALEIVRKHSAQRRVAIERIALAGARDRVLAQDVLAAHDLPPFENSAMDGFALRGADLPTGGESAFEIIGDVFAGATCAPNIGEKQCVRITTGAPIPPGADTVVIKENVRVEDNRAFVRTGEQGGVNVRAAGEDFAAGSVALQAGTHLRPSQLAVLAALGIAEVGVRRKPRATVIATGNELVAAGQPLQFGQIHESNGVLLGAQLRESGADVVMQTQVRDDPAALRAALLDASAQSDLIVSSGGVSAGEADLLPALLAELGEIHFHKVRVKPGMPILFGALGACLYFGLPGNPVSSAVTFRLFVCLALSAMLGESGARALRWARLAEAVHKSHLRAELLRCGLNSDRDGVTWATPHARQGSGMLRGLAESDALVLIPEDAHELERGALVSIWPY